MKLGSYELLNEIGRGGAAVVYRARGKDGRDVAVKLFLGTEPDELARFLREQKVHATLGAREGYVPLVDTGTSEEGPWLVMPFMRGGTLRDRLEQGPFEVEAARALGKTIATSLGRAHERGIVHRDLKPENILFSSDDRAFISDLGLAKHFRTDVKSRAATVTQVGEFYGTVGYMAPEQVGDGPGPSGTPSVVAAPADVFALGSILYECLAGRPTFPRATVFGVVRTLATTGIDPIQKVRPEVPADLSGVIQKALARFAKDRYADGHAFAAALGGP